MVVLRRMIVVACLASGSCRCPGREAPEELPISPPSRVCDNPSLSAEEFCMPATRIETWLERTPLRVLDAQVTQHGSSKPLRLRIEVKPKGDKPLAIYAKWKAVPPAGDDANNTPRREIAAYRLQKMLASENEYVVPPVVLRCLPPDAPIEGEPFPRTRCLLGALAYWLTNVTELSDIDRERLKHDLAYRRNVALLNIFTVLVAQRDSVGQNFLVSTDSRQPRVFSVDNTMTFGRFKYNPISLFTSKWLDVRVPTFPRAYVERLRSLRREDFDALAVVSELELKDGMLEPVERSSPPFDRDSGFRWRGNRVQFGLTQTEIDEIEDRRKTLLELVDRGEVRVEPQFDNSSSFEK
jgi:hypothetical protein